MAKNQIIGATFMVAQIDPTELAASVKSTRDATLLLAWIAASAYHADTPKRYAYLMSLASETLATILRFLPKETLEMVIVESRKKKWVDLP